MLIAALFRMAKPWKLPKCPSMDEWIKKIWYMYTMEYYLEKGRVKSCHLQGLESIMLSEISQTKTNIM